MDLLKFKNHSIVSEENHYMPYETRIWTLENNKGERIKLEPEIYRRLVDIGVFKHYRVSVFS